MSDDHKLTSKVAEAREWFVELNSGESSDETIAQFKCWLASSVENKVAFKQQVTQWEMLGMTNTVIAQILEEVDALQQPSNIEKLSWWLKPIVGLALAASLLLVVLVEFTPEAPHQFAITSSYATGVGEVRNISLSDGSQVTLGPKSSLKISMGQLQRQSVLSYGTAYFAIAKNDKVPFYVDSGQAHVMVTGTEFEVSNQANQVQVAVVEGSVEVANTKRSQTVALTPGLKVEVSSVGTLNRELQRFNPQQLLSWLEGRLVFDNQPLGEFIERVQPYVSEQIQVVDSDLLALTITSSMRVDNVYAAIETLPVIYPLDIVRTPSSIVIQAKSL